MSLSTILTLCGVLCDLVGLILGSVATIFGVDAAEKIITKIRQRLRYVRSVFFYLLVISAAVLILPGSPMIDLVLLSFLAPPDGTARGVLVGIRWAIIWYLMLLVALYAMSTLVISFLLWLVVGNTDRRLGVLSVMILVLGLLLHTAAALIPNTANVIIIVPPSMHTR